MCSNNSSSFIIEGQKRVKNDCTREKFTPGESFIPIYSCDYKNVFSHWIKNYASFDPLNVRNIYLRDPSQIKCTQQTNATISDQIRKNTTEPPLFAQEMASYTIDNVSKQLPIDLFYQALSAQNDDGCNDFFLRTPEMISKAMFDKLVREMVKIKKDNVLLRKQNHQLFDENRKILQQSTTYQNQASGADKMCEMSVVLPPERDFIKKEDVGSNQQWDMASPRSIDIQSDKKYENLTSRGPFVEDMNGLSAAYGDPQPHHKRSEVEEYLSKEIEKLKNTSREEKLKNEAIIAKLNEEIHRLTAMQESCWDKLQIAVGSLKDEKERNLSLRSILEDERSRFRRDIGSCKKEIDRLKPNSNASEKRSNFKNKRV